VVRRTCETWCNMAALGGWALLTAWRRSHVVTNVGFLRLHGQLVQGRRCTCLVVKLRRRAQQLEPAGPHRWQYLLIVRVGFAADCHKVLCARDEPRAGTAWAKRGVHWPERISGVRPERALRRLGCAGWAPDELFLYLPISNALRRFTFEYSF
jgi:hypothetical protein